MYLKMERIRTLEKNEITHQGKFSYNIAFTCNLSFLFSFMSLP